jgi:hypothetical protein
MHRQGPQRLARRGLLDRIARTGCPLIDTIVSDFGDEPLRVEGLAVDGVPIGCAPRRWALIRSWWARPRQRAGRQDVESNLLSVVDRVPGLAERVRAGRREERFFGALRDAELLTEGLDEGLSGRRPMNLALADYERRRNDATPADYRLNPAPGALPPAAAGGAARPRRADAA